MISTLTITIGLFYLLAAISAAALLRTSSAPIAWTMASMALLVVLACATYETLPDAFGYPVDVAFSELPQQAELIAYVPHDDEKKVVLWLMHEGSSEPRAYKVEETDALKKTLANAKKAQAAGQRTELAKGGGKPRPPAYTNMDGGQAPYELLPDAFHLPSKGDAQ